MPSPMAPAAKSGKQKHKKGLLDDEQEQEDEDLQLRVNESYAKRFEVGLFLHAGMQMVRAYLIIALPVFAAQQKA